ncbi:hypothetical protein JCM3770_007409 [Rhodotorula araucariae]
MPDTDYDSLPSPPRSRARPRTTAGGTAGGRLYGKKAARRVGMGSAHYGAPPGAASSSEEERGIERQGGRPGTSTKRAPRGEGAAKGVGREGAPAGREVCANEGDVESNDNDAEGDGKVVSATTSRVFQRGSKRSKTSAKLTSAKKKVRKSVAETDTAASTSDGQVAMSAAAGPSRRISASRSALAAISLQVEQTAAPARPSKPSIAVQDTAGPSTTASEAKARQPPRGTHHLSPELNPLQPVLPRHSPRARALTDKSNLTADSPRRARSQSRPSQPAPASLAPRPSTRRPSSPGVDRLTVFRDILPGPSPGPAGTSTRLAPPARASLPASSRLSAANPRIPRAASRYRLAYEPPPSHPPPAHRSLSRSPSATTRALARRSISLHSSPRAPERTSPALLAIPGTSRNSLAPSSLPAPWALAAPALARLDASSSPAPTDEGAPVFRYTTTEFGDAPSLRLSLDAGARRSPAAVDGDDDAPGMDSSIVLETWEDELIGLAGGSEDTTPMEEDADEGEGEGDGDETVKPARMDIEGSRQPVRALAVDVDPHAGHERDGSHGGEAFDPVEESGDGDAKEEIGDETIKAVLPVLEDCLGSSTAAPAQPDDPFAETAVEDAVDRDGSPATECLPSRVVSAASPSPQPAFFTATAMPPRRTRPSVDAPLSTGPPDDEDDLGYYLRTTGTFSSEDDLPSSAPSDASDFEDYLAEREVGRAVKPSSRQREKRLAARAAANRLRVDGRRRGGREREVLDVGDVKLSRVVRQAIEKRAVGVTEAEEEEIRAALREQKAGWRTG